MKRNWIVTGLMFLFAQVSQAEEDFPEAVARVYANGNYDGVIALAKIAPDPDFQTLILHAEARLARYSIGASPDPAHDLDVAEQLAGQALGLRSNAVRPRFVQVGVIGYRARKRSLFTGLRRSWASKGRNIIDEALRLEPQNPWSHVLSGSWHLEILRRTSIRRAKWVGAGIAEGLHACETAISLAPNDARITGQCGLALLGARQEQLDEPGWRALARAANDNQQTDAFACLRRQQAQNVLALHQAKDEVNARKLAIDYLLGKANDLEIIATPRQCAPSTPHPEAPAPGRQIPD